MGASLPPTLALILIEHDIDLALGLVDRVVCMYQGAVLVDPVGGFGFG